MRLVYLGLSGFRRFVDAEAQLHGRLMALVGPNESGKSSLLDALEHLNSDQPFPLRDISHEHTYDKDHRVLRARFLLEDADRDAISHLLGGKDARWFVINKLRDGTIVGDIEPPLELPLRPRQASARTLGVLLRTKWGSSLEETNEELNEKLSVLRNSLESAEVISSEDRERIQEVVEALTPMPEAVPKPAERLVQQLRNLVDTEPTESPHEEAEEILLKRRPAFLKFSQDDRDLKSEYSLVDMDLGIPAGALQNLARLGNLT